MSRYSFLGRLINPQNYSNDTSHISNIYNNIVFLGSQYSTDSNTINKFNISHIISIGSSPLQVSPNIKYFKFEAEDNGDPTNVSIFFTQTIPKIHSIINECVKNGTPVLVHCIAGKSRSASAIITWLMKTKSMTYSDAFYYVKDKRPVISPNISFIDYMQKI